MTAGLRILITADPELPVPPRLYGGIERVIALLAEGLVNRGHDVCVVAHRDSTVRARLVRYPRAGSGLIGRSLNAAVIAATAVRWRPDVIHSFGRLSSLAGTFPLSVPKVMSYQRPITPRSVRLGQRLAGGRVTFTACSDQMIASVRSMAAWRVIYNAVNVDAYVGAFRVSADAPLVFLGRIEPIKGPDVAIEVARRAGRRLVLAGNVPADHRDFFAQFVQPYLDGERVKYLGPVDDLAKNRLLGDAAALLMPVQWDEPFGIVMAEALACGTPVVGFRRGAVPEVVASGSTGYVCDDVEGMIAAIGQLATIDRRACREDAEQRFSQSVLVGSYEALYRELAEPAPAADLTRAPFWARSTRR